MRNVETVGLPVGMSIVAVDEPGAGGANHHYQIRIEDATSITEVADIMFQDGPVGEAGFNGATQEALLGIVIDRLESFQSGDYRCRENALAITKIEEALHWLDSRTRKRQARGVEGTSAK